jgi:hypothetical protein
MSGNFRKGAEAAADASKGGGNFARTQFFGIEDGKTAIVRFLTDAQDWIVVDQHQVVPTKPAPADWPAGSNWPEKMGSVCRKDPAFAGVYDECYICDHVVDGKKVRKAGARTWALACLREEVLGDGTDALGGPDMKGKVVGIRDQTREVTLPEKDGQPEKTVTEKAIVVVNMGYKNFFSILQGFAGRYGTVLDRDYWIKRSGSSTDTTYQIVPLDPIETASGRFDLRNPEFMARYQSDVDLEQVISDRADDEFYARFFDPRVTVSKEGKVEASGQQAAPPPPPDQDVSPERMAALASRVKGYGPQGDAPPLTTESSGTQPAPAPAAAAAGGGMQDFG